MRKLRMIGAIGALILTTGVTVALASPAQADTDCRTVTVELPARPDSGVKGNNWAVSEMTRTTKVCATASEGDWSYKATVTDEGTFKTLYGHSPGGTVTLKRGTTGTVTGGFEAAFTAPGWDSADKLTTPGTGTSTGAWVATAFPGAKFDAAGSVAKWGWTYKTACEEWINAEVEPGNSKGDITGKTCPTPDPTTAPTTQPTTSPTAVPGTGGGSGALPVTGAAATTIAGGAALLLIVGGVLFFVARRRKVTFTA